MTQGHSRVYNSGNVEGLGLKLSTHIDRTLCYMCMNFGFDSLINKFFMMFFLARIFFSLEGGESFR